MMDEKSTPPALLSIFNMQNLTKYRGAIVFVLALLLVLLGFFVDKKNTFFTGKSYGSVYSLVDEKISQSASIIINLPKGIAKEGADKLVKFEPAIPGHWANSGGFSSSIVFEPDQPLDLGQVFTATFSNDETVISKDFEIVEDPRIIATFPTDRSDTNEDSMITFVFNRPMVPLSDLTSNEVTNIPIEITPKTEGKFKWISNKVLQFIPKEHLNYSSQYVVNVLGGIKSVDGVPAPRYTFSFQTRPLNFQEITQGTILYDQPIDIKFNVPIDLDKTVKYLSVNDNATKISIPVVVDYGKRYEYDKNGKPTKVIVDRSVMSIYAKSDRNGRGRIWDFGTSVGAHLKKAVALNGDIDYSSNIYSGLTVTDAIKSVTASSDRGEVLSERLFDPEGVVTVEFFEDINLSESSISAKAMSGIEYGQKCKDDQKYVSDESCKKVKDKSKIEIKFRPQDLSLGEKVSIDFKKIVNDNGLTINSGTVTRTVSVYPKLQIFAISPENGSADASLTSLTICSNSPLKRRNSKNYKEAIKSNDYLVFNSWGYAYLKVESVPNDSNSDKCAVGQYVNSIRYGLHPDKNYNLNLTLSDNFGQTIEKNISFKTGAAPAFYSRLFSLHKVYSVTTPNKTKLTFGSENLEYVDMLICKISPESMVKYLRYSTDLVTSNDDINCLSRINKRIELPHKYWVNNFFQIDLTDYLADTRGQYVISLTNPNFKSSYDRTQRYLRSYISVTNLAVNEKRVSYSSYDQAQSLTQSLLNENGVGGSLYWVSSSETLEPISGANVKILSNTGDYQSDVFVSSSGKTESDGVANVPISKNVVGAVVTYGNDTAIISTNTDMLGWGGSAYSESKTYIYTDRPIYRPGQEVYIKGISRFQFDGFAEIIDKKTTELTIYNSKNEVILKQDIPITEFGTFSTRLTLPNNTALGTYRIESSSGYFYFDVSEYEGAAFEVINTSNQDEYVAGDKAQILTEARYYFGAPVVGGKLTYTWTAQNYYFDKYQDEYFNFGNDWYSCWSCGYGDSYVGNGETSLDMSGRAKIEKDLNFDEIFSSSQDKSKAMSKIFVLHGTITDSSGKSVSFQKSFVVHRGEYYIGAKTEPYFAGVGDDVKVKIKTVNKIGEPISKMGLKLKAYKVEWKSAKRQEVDGGYYNQYERVLSEVATRTFSTDSNGNGSASIKFDGAGEYQVTVYGTDSKGNEISTDTYTYIYGTGEVSIQPRNNETLDILSEKNDLKVGENAKIIIKSPFKKAKALMTIERGGIYKYEIVDVNQSIYEYTLPIGDSYSPSVYVSALLLGNGPQIKFGQVMLNVESSSKKLNIKVTPDKKQYLPGEKVKLIVKTTDSLGKPQSAEVSVAVADLSVLALKGNQKKDPEVFFYGHSPLFVNTASNVKNLLLESDIPTGTKGGDGSNPEDLAKRKRGEFKDTAYWEANVVTGPDGLASVEFTLPDNLTRWQVESLGVTKDTKIGVNYEEISVAKKVMAIPLTPRFIIPGDEFSIGVNIFNQSEASLNMSVTLDSQTLNMDGPDQQNVNLKDGENKTVYFKVVAPKDIVNGEHKFVISVKSSNYEDEVEKSIKIKRNETYESVATYGSTSKSKATEYIYLPDDILKDSGGLKITANASLAFFLSDAVTYLAEFPYGCSEQMASKLKMLALIKYANSKDVMNGKLSMPKIDLEGVSYDVDAAINKGLNQIISNQNSDGGFSYYGGMSSSMELTLNIYDALNVIKSAGFSVPSSTLENALYYVASRLEESDRAGNLGHLSTDNLIMMTSSLSRSNVKSLTYTSLVKRISSQVTNSYINDIASTKSLVNLALLINKEPALYELKSKVWNALENRINIDSRGSYIKSNPNNTQWFYYENPVSNTAQYLKALVIAHGKSTQVENILRWLLGSKDTNGAWGSTDSTYSVLDALVTYLADTEEGDSEFNLTVYLDGQSVASKEFKGRDLLKPLTKFLPIDALELNKSHKIEFVKSNSNKGSNFYYDLGLTYYQSAEEIAPRDEGIYISRNYYKLTDTNSSKPINEAKVGEIIRGQIKVVTSKQAPLIALESFIPAGFEIVDFNLSTEDKVMIENNSAVGYDQSNAFSKLTQNWTKQLAAVYDESLPQVYEEDLRIKHRETPLRSDFQEIHDDRLFLFNEDLWPGQYVYDYYIRATTPGTFQELPAVAKLLYFPEVFGRTGGGIFTVSR